MDEPPPMDWDARSLAEGLDLFRELVAAQPALQAEFEASALEYFRGPAPVHEANPAARSARRRHLEWFLFERPGSSTQPCTAERLLALWCQRAPAGWAEGVSAFLNSHASMFEVVAVEPGHGAELHDLAGLGRYPVEEPEAAQVLQLGDLVVGRLFPVGGGHQISASAGFFRSPQLMSALTSDLERLRQERRHAVLRVAQPELEAMFWGGAGLAATADPVGEARRFLLESGLEAGRVQALLDGLAAAPFDPEVVVPGAGDRLGEVLALLAFDSQVDLERARIVLLAAWTRMAAELNRPATKPAPRAPNKDVARAIDEFDRDRASGMDLERSFEKLERSLGLDEASEGAEEDVGPAPDFPGVVAAVIEEFLWEIGRTEGAESVRALEPLRALGEYAQGVGVLENLSARDLLAFAGFWLPERRLLRTEDDARAMLRALRRFCAWAGEAQSLELAGRLHEHLDGLERSLPRIARANLGLAPSGAETDELDPGRLYELRGADGSGSLWLLDGRGSELVAQLDPRIAGELRPGDRLRVRLGASGPAVLCAYPPEVAELVEAG